MYAARSRIFLAVGMTALLTAACVPEQPAPPLTLTRITVGNGSSGGAVISADGSTVAFSSLATDLTPGTDANGALSDVFIHDVASGVTSRVTNGDAASGSNTLLAPIPGERQTSNFIARSPVAISADGRFVAFVSGAKNLVSGGSPGFGDRVFRFDRTTGATLDVSGVSPCSPSPGPTIDGALADVQMSADGHTIGAIWGCAAGTGAPAQYRLWRDGSPAAITDFPIVVPSGALAALAFLAGDASVLDLVFAGASSNAWSRLDLATGVSTPMSAGVIPLAIGANGRYVRGLLVSSSQEVILDTVLETQTTLNTGLGTVTAMSSNGTYVTSTRFEGGPNGGPDRYSHWRQGGGAARLVANGTQTTGIGGPPEWMTGTAFVNSNSIADDGTVVFSSRVVAPDPPMQITLAR